MATAEQRRHLLLGITLLALFAVVLVVFFLPIFNGRTGMQAADDLFNSLSKGSSYYIPAVAEEAPDFRNTSVSFSVKTDDQELQDAVVKVFSSTGATVEAAEGAVKVSGDLGILSEAALADADALYNEDTAALESKYGIGGRMAVYAWYQGFTALEKSSRHDGQIDVANFSKKVMTKALEPAYNFAGIPAAKFSERLAIAAFLLIFYVVYTVWYGFGVMYIFEGLGISASSH